MVVGEVRCLTPEHQNILDLLDEIPDPTTFISRETESLFLVFAWWTPEDEPLNKTAIDASRALAFTKIMKGAEPTKPITEKKPELEGDREQNAKPFSTIFKSKLSRKRSRKFK